MHLCVIVPSEDHLATAGVRIRYQRTAVHLERLGHRLSITVLDELRLDPERLADLYLICKCHDARSIMAAAGIRALGRQVGADFFDDYYSQGDDSRFVHIREWLRRIAPFLTFALCSTPLMGEAIARILPGLPCHMLNDPYDALDEASIGASVERKLARIHATGTLDIGWFGIGDNPHFPVGLSDLCDFGGMLAGLAATGLTPRLAILTNRRALSVERLEMLKRLPLPWALEEWSEEAERRLIAESYACFLPVNAQRFSTMKSLNRAVTALSGGAQVLSAGFPLYESLSPFIYRDTASLLADIRSGTPRLRSAVLGDVAALMAQHADPATEAAKLAEFMGALRPPAPVRQLRFAVIHGRQSSGHVHKFAQRAGHLSVAAPWTAGQLNYDLRILQKPDGAVASLSDRARALLKPELARGLRTVQESAPRSNFELPLAAAGIAAGLTPGTVPPLDAAVAAAYDRETALIETVCAALFGAVTPLISETASPFWRCPGAAAPAEAAA